MHFKSFNRTDQTNKTNHVWSEKIILLFKEFSLAHITSDTKFNLIKNLQTFKMIYHRIIF